MPRGKINPNEQQIRPPFQENMVDEEFREQNKIILFSLVTSLKNQRPFLERMSMIVLYHNKKKRMTKF
jgi:hypothetical protein